VNEPAPEHLPAGYSTWFSPGPIPFTWTLYLAHSQHMVLVSCARGAPPAPASVRA